MATISGTNNNYYKNDICSYSNNNSKKWFLVSLTVAIWAILTLATGTAVQAAAVYSNVDFQTNPNFEPICTEQQERFIESEGKESSLILEFNTDDSQTKSKSCKRILSAPSAYGFIVRLILPKIRQSHLHHVTSIKRATNDATAKSKITALDEMTTLMEKLNATSLKSGAAAGVVLGRTCPLSIFSSLDPHTPQWRVDPCQLEDTAPEMEDPVRLFHGRVRIVWEHNNNALDSKLMVTVLGKGDQCRSESKHQCLKIGDEPILCISKDLICDGIRHCPYSNEYDSDEDYTMCWKRRRFGEPLPASESVIFEHFAFEIFRNLFAFDVPSMPGATKPSASSKSTPTTSSDAMAATNSTTLRKVDSKQMSSAAGETTAEEGVDMGKNATTLTNGTELNGPHRRNSTRMGLNSDLSKYGPWGYLMLGMLLCGGALLICGLWASASQHATNNERESALQNGANNSSIEHQSSGGGAPPNYEELDPPPSYSVLFPNQKAASSTTLNSLTQSVSVPTAPDAGAVSMMTTSSSSTRVQLETQASSSGSSSSGAGGVVAAAATTIAPGSRAENASGAGTGTRSQSVTN